MNVENKICPNCGTANNLVSKFCVRCGTPIGDATNLSMNNPTQAVEMPQPNANIATEPVINNIEPTVEMVQPNVNIAVEPVVNNIQPQVNTVNTGVVNNPIPQVNPTVNNSPLNYLMFVIAFLLKPFQTFKEEEGKLQNTKTALIFSGIVAGAMMLIELIKAMINVVVVKTLDLSAMDFNSMYKTTIEFGNLKNLNYLELIFKNLLIYAGIIVAITVVYYLGSLILKKTINFNKMLSITTVSIIPFVIVGMVVAPLLGLIHSTINIAIAIIGAIYSIIIFISLVNENITFDKKDIQIYFHAICLSILCVAAYYIGVIALNASINNAINGGLGELGDLGNYMDYLN